MSKYSDEALKEMSQETVKARTGSDPRFTALLLTMCQITNLHPQEVWNKIQELAK